MISFSLHQKKLRENCLHKISPDIAVNKLEPLKLIAFHFSLFEKFLGPYKKSDILKSFFHIFKILPKNYLGNYFEFSIL